jgi:NAD(P)H-hydrate repair Nnr-like enzyme with NAD(P)H-hydrate dehydratase domain
VTTALQRTVLVVGRHVAEAPRLYPADVDGSMAVVVITVGWPMTAAQSNAVDQALELARERRVVFDAFLVGSITEGLEVVDTRDRVLFAGDRREGKRIVRGLGPRGITASVAR